MVKSRRKSSTALDQSEGDAIIRDAIFNRLEEKTTLDKTYNYDALHSDDFACCNDYESEKNDGKSYF